MSDAGDAMGRRRDRGPFALALLALLALFFFAGFVALGTWQVYRLSWKLDLIARVDHRIHADPVAAPGPRQWPTISANNDEYLRVRAIGTFLHDRQTLVRASTVLGSGFWVITPLREADGTLLLVNRGFVSDVWCGRNRQCAAGPAGEVTVVGLVRMTEPRGGFLRSNDPAHDRWYSRDVQAIAQARGLTPVAPYFIDEAASTSAGDTGGNTTPVGGLTVTTFPNNHLVYAITWYILALMVVAAAWYVGRDERRRRQR